MTARTVSPTVFRDEALQSVKDHIEDADQLDNLRSLKVDFNACLSAAGRMLDPSAIDLQPQDIANASEWLGHAEDQLARMMTITEERFADMREQDRQQRHDELMRALDIADGAVGQAVDGAIREANR